VHLAELLTPSRVACGLSVASKKRALEDLSQLIAAENPNLQQNEIFDSLIARERLGSTGLGKGVAIPHGRLKSSNETILAFIKLDNGIDYDAPDGERVDLLCALVVPAESTDEHLEILAKLTEIFRSDELRKKIRNINNPQKVHEILTTWLPN